MRRAPWETRVSDFGWAVVGPGKIAQRFGKALRGIGGARLAAVAARDAGRAAAFAREWQDAARPAFVSDDLAAVLAREDVDAVYVATPHPFHAAATRAALSAGKPVLCEKPMTCDAASARELVELARSRNVFLMEALWTRFLPLHALVQQWLAAGEIGAVRAMQSSFCLDRPFQPGDRRYSAALAGGTLLDIGIYNIHVSRMALPGVAVRDFDIRARLAAPADNPVDVQSAVTLDFGDGRWSQFHCGFYGNADNAFRIVGERGQIQIHGGFWEATAATLQRDGQPPRHAHEPFRINGFEYEIEEAMRCIRAGLPESPRMPLAETLAVLELIDAMRRQIGLRYPFE